jgi:hypothetical protein
MYSVQEGSLKHDHKRMSKCLRVSLMSVVLTSYHSQIPGHASLSLETICIHPHELDVRVLARRDTTQIGFTLLRRHRAILIEHINISERVRIFAKRLFYFYFL